MAPYEAQEDDCSNYCYSDAMLRVIEIVQPKNSVCGISSLPSDPPSNVTSSVRCYSIVKENQSPRVVIPKDNHTLSDEAIEEYLEKQIPPTAIQTTRLAFKALRQQQPSTKRQRQENSPNQPNNNMCQAPGCKRKVKNNNLKKSDDSSASTTTTPTTTALCPQHLKQLLNPILRDYEKERKSWPRDLQQQINEFESVELSDDEKHVLVFQALTNQLQLLSSSSTTTKDDDEAQTVATVLLQLQQAIATYRDRWILPEPISTAALLQLVVSCMISIGESNLAAAAFCATLAISIPALLIGIGIWRRDVFLLRLGFGAAIGGGVGLIVGGPVGGAAGVAIATGVMGLFLTAKDHHHGVVSSTTTPCVPGNE